MRNAGCRCFVAGTMHHGRAHDEPALGGLSRLNAGTLELLDTDIGVTNGPCFSPDGAIFYLADSARRSIWAYDYRSREFALYRSDVDDLATAAWDHVTGDGLTDMERAVTSRPGGDSTVDVRAVSIVRVVAKRGPRAPRRSVSRRAPAIGTVSPARAVCRRAIAFQSARSHVLPADERVPIRMPAASP